MNISERLLTIANFCPKSECLADIGTDHGYIPIYCCLNNISQRAIASDIGVGPIKIAKKNIVLYKLEDKIETRVGPGLSVLKKGEADTILISGMGGNLISEIIDENKEIAAGSNSIILQPVQYPEELRRYLITSGFNIIDEELVKDENKYYHIIKAIFQRVSGYDKSVYYYTGIKLIEKKHPLLIEYIKNKIYRIDTILDQMNNSTQSERKLELTALKAEFKEVMAKL